MRWLLLAVAALLLTSIGGAGIILAPITLPLLYLTARQSPRRGYRVAAAIVAGVAAAEVAWAATYVVAGDVEPLIWLVPLVALMATITAMLRVGRDPGRREGRARVVLR